MFDTMTMTKIVGGVCGALLLFLLGNWTAAALYSTGGGHGEGEHAAYSIDTGEDHGGEEADAGPSFAEVFAAADAAKGEKAWGKCKACHKLEDGANGTGPHLFDVVGRDIAAVGDFGYSGAMSDVGGAWTPEELDAWLADPKSYAPGNKMSFKGMGKIEDRANLIAYLVTHSPSYVPAEPAPAAEEEAPAEEAPAEEDHGTAEEPAEEDHGAVEEPAAETETAMAETEETVTTEEPVAAATDFAAALAAADVVAGEKTFAKCKICHVADEQKNRIGPYLLGVVGRDVATAEGFSYSDAVAGLGGVWAPERLNEWLTDPKAYAPGTKMTFAGLPELQDRANVIAFLSAQ